jgi:hypothetical protein
MAVLQMTIYMFRLSFSQSIAFSFFITYHRILSQRNMTGDASGTGIVHPSEVHEFDSGF